jgi:hypothetical protein
MVGRSFFPIAVWVMVLALFPDAAFAAWARHDVVSWDTRSTKYPVAVEETTGKSFVRIFVPVKEGEKDLGYFVIRSKKRLGAEELEFRMSMTRWKSHEERLQKARENPRYAVPVIFANDRTRREEFLADVERFESMERVEPETRDGARGIFLDLTREEAMRTYLVYDFLPWGGAGVRDGGLWLTYDLPSFVEQAGRRSDEFYGRKSGGAQFRIRKVAIQEGEGGWRSFRVTVEKIAGELSLKRPRTPGVRLRVWERQTDGSLALADLPDRPEWDAALPDWPEGKTKDLVLNWKGNETAYAGFSVDLIYSYQLQDAWSSAPEFRTHLLAVESLSDGDLSYRLRPDRLFSDYLKATSDHKKGIRENDPEAATASLENSIAALEMLEREYPDWRHADTVKARLREYRKMKAEPPQN